MRKVINAINELTMALYGATLNSNAIASILDNGLDNAIKLQKELQRALEEEDSIV